MERNMPDQHPHVKEMEYLLRKLRDLHMEVSSKMMEIMDQVGKQAYQADADLVDLGYIFRTSKDLLEDWRKVAHKSEEKCGFVLGYRVAERSLTDPNTETTVHGSLAYANTDLNYIVSLPNEGSDDYIAVMAELGVPKEVALTKRVKLDYRKTQEYITNLVADGKKLPSWCKQPYPNYTAIFVKKRAAK
jgi:hypothetical protein